MNNDALILNVLTQRLGSADWSKWQIQRWSYFDYVRYPVLGTNQLSFFANALGATDPASGLSKTQEDTNMPKARTFGQQYYIIRQIRTHINILPKNRQQATVAAEADYTGVWAAAAQWLEQLAGLGVLLVKIGQKDYFNIEQPFKFCPPGFGVDNVIPMGVATAINYYNQQSHLNQDVYALTPPQLIEPEQSFEANIDFPFANSPATPELETDEGLLVNIGLIFDGYIARPAQ